jgi:hypothetical protein
MLRNTFNYLKILPSVITTTKSNSAYTAYKIASAAPGGGT